VTEWSFDPSAAVKRRRTLSYGLSLGEFAPPSAVVQVEFGSHSRAAPDRRTNEDHVLIVHLSRHQDVVATTLAKADVPPPFEEHGYAMVVAGGSGNLGAGALASRVAVSTLAHLAIHFGRWNLRVDARTAEEIIDRAEWFYERAARAVQRHSRANPLLEGMRSSLTATFSAGDELFYAHAGNSRAYLFRDGELTRLTRDNVLSQPPNEPPGSAPMVPADTDLRSILTDAVGAGDGSDAVQVERLGLIDNDTILLCTDGLTKTLSDEAVAESLAQARRPDDQCRALVDLAFDRGADDHVTAVLAKYRIPSFTQ
jgi:PPM family protein phosphatase